MTDYYNRISPYDLGPNSKEYHRGVTPSPVQLEPSASERELNRRYLEAGACFAFNQAPILKAYLAESPAERALGPERRARERELRSQERIQRAYEQTQREQAAERERIIPIELARPEIASQPETTLTPAREAA